MPPTTLRSQDLRPVYLLLGAESYFRDLFRARVLALLPPEGRDFAVFDEDLSSTPLDTILDRARTPSLMAPLQLFFIRNVKELFTRASARASETPADSAPKGGKRKHGDFPANLQAFAGKGAPGASAVLVFVADHIEIPAERNRIGMEDKAKLQRLEEVFGPFAEIVSCARVSPTQAAQLATGMAITQQATLPPDAATLLAEALDANLGLIAREVEKLALHALPDKVIRRDVVEELVSSTGKGSAFELALLLARRDRPRALACLRKIWADGGDSEAIPLVFQLGRIFKMALVARQAGVRDVSSLYHQLPDGLKPPGFAAQTVLAVSQRLPEKSLWDGIRQLQDVDVAVRSSPLSVKLLFERVIFHLTANAA